MYVVRISTYNKKAMIRGGREGGTDRASERAGGEGRSERMDGRAEKHVLRQMGRTACITGKL